MSPPRTTRSDARSACSFAAGRRPTPIPRMAPSPRAFQGYRPKSGGGRGVSFAAGIDGDRPLDDSGRREPFDESTATDADPASNEASSSLGRTREVFDSFGADADVDRPRHARKRRSLLDRAIAAAASKSKARKEPDDGRRGGGREDIAAFNRRKGAKRADRAPKRESFVGRVLSHNTKSGNEAPKHGDSDCKSSTKQRRGSLRFVANSLKYAGRAAPVAVADDNETTARRKPNRSRQSKENDLGSSLVVFDKVASEKYSKRGSLLAAKADHRHRNDPSMMHSRGGSSGSGRHEVRIKMGGEEGYDAKIASILYSGQ